MNENPLNRPLRAYRLLIGIVVTTVCGITVFSQAAEPLLALVGHITPQIANAALLQRAPADEPVQLSLVVKLDQNLLDATYQELYGQKASVHKHFLSSDEFAQQFGLADKRSQLKNFALANGLTINSDGDNDRSMVVKVSGSAGTIEQAFNIHLNHYRARDGRLFRANDADPMIPASLTPHLGAILGLSNLTSIVHPHIRHTSRNAPSSIFPGTGPGYGLSPDDIKAIYGLNSTTLTGSGQTVALFELDGYNPSDIALYESQFKLPDVTVTPVMVNGATNACGSSCDEVTLDIEMVMALAPGVSQILVYEGQDPQGTTASDLINTYQRIQADNKAQVVSTSWGENEQDSGFAFIQSESTIFQSMATQGQSIYAAAGDCGAYDQEDSNRNCITNNGFRVDDPASQPYVTGVGGTSLSGTVQSYTEVVWNEFSISNGATGGGVSAGVNTNGSPNIPSYQSNVNTTANGGSSTMRNVPDVALNADPDTSPYSICLGGSCNNLFGGTSAAAPLWAAMTALINQQRSSAGLSVLGFANTTLYQLGASTSSATVFNDITSGNNGIGSTGFKAGSGYDNTTGWGSFKGAGMINTAGATIPSVPVPSLTNIYAYPNPWDTRKNSANRFITFANGLTSTLPDGATIKIFTLSGFLVKTLTVANGIAIWQDLTNDAGQRVASGLYFYVASSGGNQVRGTIAIIK
jgi:kumamolisin